MQTEPSSPFTTEQRDFIERVKGRMRVSKVVCTRALKTKNGDFFVGFSSAWDTIQEDAGGMGTDLIDAMGPGDQQTAMAQRGMTTREAKVAACILGMQVELQAMSHALAGSGITEAEYRAASAAVKRNYGRLLHEAVAIKSGRSEPAEGKQ